MKHLKLFENNNKDTFNILVDSLSTLENIKPLILQYISFKENYNPPGFYVVDIMLENNGEILIITDSDNNSYFNYHISPEDKDEFNLFCNNPEMFVKSKKYNL